MPLRLTIDEILRARDVELPPSRWVEIDQDRVQRFADATGDRQWIHVDPERARNGPFGGTIAHGYLTLSLVASLALECLEVPDAAMVINYGAERLRFPAPVPAGSAVRLRGSIVDAAPRGDGALYRLAVTIEVRGAAKPAVAAEVLFLALRRPAPASG